MSDDVPSSALNETYSIESDFRGETIYYIEPARKVSISWTWTNGYRIYASSIERWENADGASTPVTDDQRKQIIERVVTYARVRQHVTMIVEP
ncbi:MAG: hypothetical protein JWL69_5003 [Phycisphaerales bacterium]|jgi:hypothetical protein|nr:hypothetical protein [Phycisphaerales bacterium]MDB5356871.1 hypothetical protein [Phycisphaerales bacterium]